MVRTITVMLALATLPLATTANAQSHGRDRREVARAQGVPPGQLPPANMCRVWYAGVPPGQQPRATSCQQAEAIAGRSRSARVIYGENVYGQYGYGRYGNDGRYGNNRPWQTSPYPDNRGTYRVPGTNRAPNGGSDPYYGGRYGGYRYGDTAYENGYRDGRVQGRDDGRDNDRFDATRQSRYRSADRGYIDSYGDKNRYKDIYREGFRAGYEEGYREGNYRR